MGVAAIADMRTAFIGRFQDTDEMASYYEGRTKELDSLIATMDKEEYKTEYGYVISGISKLTSMMLECEQYFTEINPEGDSYLVDRVVKLHRMISNFDIDRYGIDRVALGGLFVQVPMYLLPARKMEKAMKNRYRSVLNPEEFGLPSHDLVDYATYRSLSSSCYTAIAKFPDSVVNHWLYAAKHYEYAYLQ